MGQLFKYQMSIEEGGSNVFGDEPGVCLGSIAVLGRDVGEYAPKLRKKLKAGLCGYPQDA